MKIKLNNAIRSQIALLTGFTGLDTAIEQCDIDNANDVITMLNGYCNSAFMVQNMQKLVLDKIAILNVGFYPSEAMIVQNMLLSTTDFKLQVGNSLKLDKVANVKQLHFEFAKENSKRVVYVSNALDLDEDTKLAKQIAMFELKRGYTSSVIEIGGLKNIEAELIISIDNKELYIKSLAVEGYSNDELMQADVENANDNENEKQDEDSMTGSSNANESNADSAKSTENTMPIL